MFYIDLNIYDCVSIVSFRDKQEKKKTFKNRDVLKKKKTIMGSKLKWASHPIITEYVQNYPVADRASALQYTLIYGMYVY